MFAMMEELTGGVAPSPKVPLVLVVLEHSPNWSKRFNSPVLIDCQRRSCTFARVVSDEAKGCEGGIRFVHIRDAAKMERSIELLRCNAERQASTNGWLDLQWLTG